MINKKMILANRPVGIPEKNTWEYEEELISEIKDGQILIKIIFLFIIIYL